MDEQEQLRQSVIAKYQKAKVSGRFVSDPAYRQKFKSVTESLTSKGILHEGDYDPNDFAEPKPVAPKPAVPTKNPLDSLPAPVNIHATPTDPSVYEHNALSPNLSVPQSVARDPAKFDRVRNTNPLLGGIDDAFMSMMGSGNAQRRFDARNEDNPLYNNPITKGAVDLWRRVVAAPALATSSNIARHVPLGTTPAEAKDRGVRAFTDSPTTPFVGGAVEGARGLPSMVAGAEGLGIAGARVAGPVGAAVGSVVGGLGGGYLAKPLIHQVNRGVYGDEAANAAEGLDTADTQEAPFTHSLGELAGQSPVATPNPKMAMDIAKAAKVATSGTVAAKAARQWLATQSLQMGVPAYNLVKTAIDSASGKFDDNHVKALALGVLSMMMTGKGALEAGMPLRPRSDISDLPGQDFVRNASMNVFGLRGQDTPIDLNGYYTDATGNKGRYQSGVDSRKLESEQGETNPLDSSHPARNQPPPPNTADKVLGGKFFVKRKTSVDGAPGEVDQEFIADKYDPSTNTASGTYKGSNGRLIRRSKVVTPEDMLRIGKDAEESKNVTPEGAATIKATEEDNTKSYPLSEPGTKVIWNGKKYIVHEQYGSGEVNLASVQTGEVDPNATSVSPGELKPWPKEKDETSSASQSAKEPEAGSTPGVGKAGVAQEDKTLAKGVEDSSGIELGDLSAVDEPKSGAIASDIKSGLPAVPVQSGVHDVQPVPNGTSDSGGAGKSTGNVQEDGVSVGRKDTGAKTTDGEVTNPLDSVPPVKPKPDLSTKASGSKASKPVKPTTPKPPKKTGTASPVPNKAAQTEVVSDVTPTNPMDSKPVEPTPVVATKEPSPSSEQPKLPEPAKPEPVGPKMSEEHPHLTVDQETAIKGKIESLRQRMHDSDVTSYPTQLNAVRAQMNSEQLKLDHSTDERKSMWVDLNQKATLTKPESNLMRDLGETFPMGTTLKLSKVKGKYTTGSDGNAVTTKKPNPMDSATATATDIKIPDYKDLPENMQQHLDSVKGAVKSGISLKAKEMIAKNIEASAATEKNPVNKAVYERSAKLIREHIAELSIKEAGEKMKEDGCL